MEKARIEINCDKELKKQLFIQDIPYIEAFRLGAIFLTNCNLDEKGEIMKEKDKIKKEIKTLNNKLKYLDKRIENLEKGKNNKEGKEKLKNKERMAQALKANNPLRNV